MRVFSTLLQTHDSPLCLGSSWPANNSCTRRLIDTLFDARDYQGLGRTHVEEQNLHYRSERRAKDSILTLVDSGAASTPIWSLFCSDVDLFLAGTFSRIQCEQFLPYFCLIESFDDLRNGGHQGQTCNDTGVRAHIRLAHKLHAIFVWKISMCPDMYSPATLPFSRACNFHAISNFTLSLSAPMISTRMSLASEKYQFAL